MQRFHLIKKNVTPSLFCFGTSGDLNSNATSCSMADRFLSLRAYLRSRSTTLRLILHSSLSVAHVYYESHASRSGRLDDQGRVYSSVVSRPHTFTKITAYVMATVQTGHM
jgi:hypothetical protein